jgi:hypothetical protein
VAEVTDPVVAAVVVVVVVVVAVVRRDSESECQPAIITAWLRP